MSSIECANRNGRCIFGNAFDGRCIRCGRWIGLGAGVSGVGIWNVFSTCINFDGRCRFGNAFGARWIGLGASVIGVGDIDSDIRE